MQRAAGTDKLGPFSPRIIKKGRIAMSDQTHWESFKVEGGQLLDEFKRLIHEGNVRRVVIKRDGESIVEFPLTVGVVGAALMPALAAVGAIAALVAECTIEVERDEPMEETTGGGSTLFTGGDDPIGSGR
jgi:hypothetical protein